DLNLVCCGDSNMVSSLRNCVLYVFGPGGGLWLGVTLGTALGSLLGPAGIVVCGIIGSLLGASLGRAATNEIKLARLRRAQETFNRFRADVEAQLAARHRALQQATLAKIDDIERALRTHLEQLEAQHRSAAEQIKAEHERSVALTEQVRVEMKRLGMKPGF